MRILAIVAAAVWMSPVFAGPTLEMKTSMGVIEIELNEEKAPVSVKNFVSYVNEKYFDGTVYHRVIDGFMIQGGGFVLGKDGSLSKKDTKAPIINEATASGLTNDRGTIAMARTNDPNSATSQFFINHKDNAFLNPSPNNPAGYAVFGKVTKGMDVVDKIAKVKTTTKDMMGDVPVEAVVIESVRLTDGKAETPKKTAKAEPAKAAPEKK